MAGVEAGWKTGGVIKGPGIPAPSGQYRVGCVDLMHQLEGDNRGLLVRLYYPTEATPEAGYSYSLCIPNKRYIKGALINFRTKLPGLMSTIIKGLTAPKMPALEAAPLYGCENKTGDDATSPGTSAAAPVFPVIVFSHGLGAFRAAYSGITCDLASHGYVVACVEHRHKSAAATFIRVPKAGGREGELEDQWIEHELHDVPSPEVDQVANAEAEFPYRNKQVKLRADDVKKSLDVLTLLNQGAEVRNLLDSRYDFRQFRGRLDISSAAAMGHSYGGATTIQALYEDSRFKCGLALDSWLIPIHPDIYRDSSSISQPLYFINSYSFQWKENMRRMMSLTRPANSEGISNCRVITIKGTNHLNQSDGPFITPKLLAQLVKKDDRRHDSLDDLTAHQVNLAVCHAFLQRHLLKYPSFQQVVPDLDGSQGHSEHLLFGTNVGMNDSVPSASFKGVVSTDVPSTAGGAGGDSASKEEGSGGKSEDQGDKSGSVDDGGSPKEGVTVAQTEEEGEVVVETEQIVPPSEQETADEPVATGDGEGSGIEVEGSET